MKYLVLLLALALFAGCAGDDEQAATPVAEGESGSPVASQFQGLWHMRNKEGDVDVDLFLLLSDDWVVTLGPDGAVHWPDSGARTDADGVLWFDKEGEDTSAGKLIRDGKVLRRASEGSEAAYDLDAPAMDRDAAIEFLVDRYAKNPEAYRNNMPEPSARRSVVLPDLPKRS